MTKYNQIKLLAEIFITFFKIGCFSFGGGYAMISIIEREVTTRKGWIKDELIDIFAISESIPGAIAINSSTFIGYKVAGWKGCIAAMLGVVLPSFIIITLIAAFFRQFQNNIYVIKAFIGIRAAVVGLIIMAAIKMSKTAIKGTLTVAILIVTVVAVFFLNVHAIYLIIAGALLGVVIYHLFPSVVNKNITLMERQETSNDIS